MDVGVHEARESSGSSLIESKEVSSHPLWALRNKRGPSIRAVCVLGSCPLSSRPYSLTFYQFSGISDTDYCGRHSSIPRCLVVFLCSFSLNLSPSGMWYLKFFPTVFPVFLFTNKPTCPSLTIGSCLLVFFPYNIYCTCSKKQWYLEFKLFKLAITYFGFLVYNMLYAFVNV